MTLEEMKTLDRDVLTSKDVSDVLRIHPSRILEYARQDKLPFPFLLSGRRVKFPRVAFINWMEGRKDKTGKQADN